MARTALTQAVALTGIALLAVGCSVPGGTVKTTSAAAPAPATVTVVAPASSSTTTTPTVATSSTSLPAPAADPSGPKVISIAPGGERVLTKADAFSSEYWDEGSYQPVGQPAQQAMAFDARCRSSRYPVEFRFGQSTGTLTFTVGQALSSRSSSERLEFALIVDGRQVESKMVAFKDVEHLSTPLAGVAAVQLVVTPNPCRDGATALITKAVIVG
ncbi:MAG TPA: hypothetical protein PKX10_11150 [Propioniciclava tarda]|nr:hypothetical protein [Propioniciclava tarda]HQA31952.1 hypothetical protein [Propioniciclava tarda]